MRILGAELTLHKLEVFCLVAHHGSVSRAAEQLALAQPVVTAHIRSLERKLGVRLTARQGRRIKLTDEGERVLVWANDIITRTRELQRELSESKAGRKGSAVIAASMSVSSYILPDMLVAFRKKYVDGDIAVVASAPREVTDAVMDGRADLGVSILDPRHDVTGLEAEPIGNDRLVLVSAAGRRLPKRPLTRREIADLPYITAQRGAARREIEDNALREAGVIRSNVVLEFGHAEAIKRAVATDTGLAFLFQSSVSDSFSENELRIVDMEDLRIDIPIYLIRRRDKRFSAFQEQLHSYLKEAFAAREA
jgi:DNA-binding transcriptional LysR family regulator